MDIRQLSTFHKVATLLSFTRAASELKYAQSTVTAQVKGLEMSLGVDLFDRLGGRIQVTEAGRRLLPYAEQMLSLADEARGATRGTDGPSGMLTVGSMESITSYRMPLLLEFFHHRYPLLHLVLRPSLCAETCHALRQGMFDLGFLMEAETRHPGVQTEVLGSEPLVVVAAPDHPLVGSEKVTTEDLRRTTVLSPEAGCAYRELFEMELNSGVVKAAPFLEFGTAESIKRGVAAGLGVSLLPTVTVSDALLAGTLVELPWTPPFQVFTQIAWRHGKTLTREMRLFVDQVLRVFGEDYAPQS
jgi:DNA-binding transcriptional LysR family regulator